MLGQHIRRVGSIRLGASAWLTTFACLILAVSVPGLISSARSAVRALDRLRRFPDDRRARFEYGWQGTFALLHGLAGCMSLGVILVLQAGSSWLALAGVFCVNLLVQPVAVLLCWIGACKVTRGLCGQVTYAWRRVPESELASLTPPERRRLAWFCVWQGVACLIFGATMVVGCAGLLVQAGLG
jgi:hypothetical protein